MSSYAWESPLRVRLIASRVVCFASKIIGFVRLSGSLQVWLLTAIPFACSAGMREHFASDDCRVNRGGKMDGGRVKRAMILRIAFLPPLALPLFALL
ncbi:MAG: hypothetical protein ACRCVV_17700 [Shewanella sp.]